VEANMSSVWSIIAWPVAFIIIVIFALVFFRKPIYQLIPRIRKITKTGIETHPEQLLQKADKKLLPEELIQEFQSPVFWEQEEIIRNELDKKGFSSDEKIAFLMKRLAFTQLYYRFEYLNSLIFGSQIQILHSLNSGQGETIETIKPTYDLAASLYPDVFRNYGFDSYLYFLTSQQLIIQQGERYFITRFGREFLTYLVQTGRSGYRTL